MKKIAKRLYERAATPDNIIYPVLVFPTIGLLLSQIAGWDYVCIGLIMAVVASLCMACWFSHRENQIDRIQDLIIEEHEKESFREKYPSNHQYGAMY